MPAATVFHDWLPLPKRVRHYELVFSVSRRLMNSYTPLSLTSWSMFVALVIYNAILSFYQHSSPLPHLGVFGVRGGPEPPIAPTSHSRTT